MSQRAANFLDLALEDYRAARLLLREGLLAQGLALASTAVEKELKAVLALKHLYTKRHLDSGLVKLAQKHFPGIKSTALDSDFMKYLTKGFDLRYATVDTGGYTIVINQRRTLMALDAAMLAIDSGFAVTQAGAAHPTPLNAAIGSRDPLIVSDNVAVGATSLEEFRKKPNKMFELRVSSQWQVLSATYVTEGLNVIGTFCKSSDLNFNKSTIQLAKG
jgi:uncharacterized protein (UPF0332 family)